MTIPNSWSSRPPLPSCLESLAWITERNIKPNKPKWMVEMNLDVVDGPAPDVYGSKATRFHLTVSYNQWTMRFVHQGKQSFVAVDNEGKHFNGGEFDAWKLADRVPPLADIGNFLASLEKQHKIRFNRAMAYIQTNLAGAKAATREWLATLDLPNDK